MRYSFPRSAQQACCQAHGLLSCSAQQTGCKAQCPPVSSADLLPNTHFSKAASVASACTLSPHPQSKHIDSQALPEHCLKVTEYSHAGRCAPDPVLCTHRMHVLSAAVALPCVL